VEGDMAVDIAVWHHQLYILFYFPGSWKDIGQSISHFGITNFIIVVLELLFLGPQILQSQYPVVL
jgi:hypothetical protein